MSRPRIPVALLVVIGLAVVAAVMAVSYYNSFAKKENDVEGQWQQVEVQYQRRVDLVPNLVEAAKGAQVQEEKIFGDIAEARTRYGQADSPEEQVGAANQLEGSLGRLLAVFENYPQLRSNENILRLQDELAGTENRVAVERRRYNDVVRDYNKSVSVFPGVVFAGVFGHDKKTYFEADAGAEEAPRVSFGDADGADDAEAPTETAPRP